MFPCEETLLEHRLSVKMDKIFLTSVYFLLSYFPALFPRLAMALFSRISIFCSGWSSVFDAIAFTTTWIGMDMDVEHTAEKALKNFLASHSVGRLSCLSTNKTLLEKNTKALMICRLYWVGLCYLVVNNQFIQQFGNVFPHINIDYQYVILELLW